jgi:hypothetical protein
VVIELVRATRDEMRIGFSEIKTHLTARASEHLECQRGIHGRLHSLETWRASLAGGYAVVAALASIAGALSAAVVAWLTGRH